MASNWLPGAKVVPAYKDGGSMLGGPRKVVWHTTENDPTKSSALQLANFLNRSGNSVHLVWNPVTGEIVQTIPANRAGRGLRNSAGGVQTNRGGSIVIQIEVVAQASKPWTETTPMKNLEQIVAWLDSLGIPREWPAGPAKSYLANNAYNRSVQDWSKSGHFAHQNVPENIHWDSGAIAQSKIAAAVVKPKPPVDPKKPVKTPDLRVVKSIQTAVHVPNDGKFGPGSANAVKAVVRKTLSNVVYLQTRVGTKPDGQWGPKSESARISAIKKIQKALGVVADGDWGPKSSAAYASFYKRNYGKY